MLIETFDLMVGDDYMECAKEILLEVEKDENIKDVKVTNAMMEDILNVILNSQKIRMASILEEKKGELRLVSRNKMEDKSEDLHLAEVIKKLSLDPELITDDKIRSLELEMSKNN